MVTVETTPLTVTVLSVMAGDVAAGCVVDWIVADIALPATICVVPAFWIVTVVTAPLTVMVVIAAAGVARVTALGD